LTFAEFVYVISLKLFDGFVRYFIFYFLGKPSKKSICYFPEGITKKHLILKYFFAIHFPFKIIQKIGEMSKKIFPKNWKNRSSNFFFYI